MTLSKMGTARVRRAGAPRASPAETQASPSVPARVRESTAWPHMIPNFSPKARGPSWFPNNAGMQTLTVPLPEGRHWGVGVGSLCAGLQFHSGVFCSGFCFICFFLDGGFMSCILASFWGCFCVSGFWGLASDFWGLCWIRVLLFRIGVLLFCTLILFVLVWF